MEISRRDREALQRLEEGLWRSEVRFDAARMNEILAPDFFEYGRSSRVYSRADTLAIPAQGIRAVLPLTNFSARLLSGEVAQTTYVSIVDYEHGEERALRSSIWSRAPSGWQLRFHQGTPLPGR